MSNIIELGQKSKPEDMVWRCHCGCSSFFIRDDMKAECQHCGSVADDGTGEWRTALPAPPASAPPIDKADVKVTVLGPIASLKSTLALVDVDKSAVVAVVQKDGFVRTWAIEFETEDQVTWLDRRLDDIRRCLIKP